jgi:glycosyltransferase involved in cell wall biosynthesis
MGMLARYRQLIELRNFEDNVYCFFGQRGGGADLLSSILSLEATIGKSSYSIVAQDLLIDLEQSVDRDNILKMNISHERWCLIRLDLYIRFFLQMILVSSGKKKKTFIFIMPHPWDLPIAQLLRLNRNKVVRIIHDDNPHLGEKWPSKKAMISRCKNSNHLIFLSDFVRRECIKNLSGGIPSYEIRPLFDFRIQDLEYEKKNYVLFVGRGKSYQGLELIPRIIEGISQLCPEVEVVIAGVGYSQIEKKIESLDNTVLIDKWLSIQEMDKLIGQARVLILPYLEGTQSGIIAKATRLGTPVLCTPVGGLCEQVNVGVNGEISETISVESIVKVATQMLKNPQKYYKIEAPNLSAWL